MVSKDELRDRFSIQRDNLGYPDVAQASHAITDKLFGAYDWTKVNKVLSYAPINHEIDPTLFENRLKRDNPNIVFEHVQPVKDAPQPDGEFDVILLPCLAADKSNYRLGTGGGWYDTFLADHKGVSIGLVYEFALVEKLPREDHDVPLKMIISI